MITSAINNFESVFRMGSKTRVVTTAKSQFKAVLALNKYVLIEFADMYQRNLRNLQNTKGWLFKQSLATVKQNLVPSHFQFTQRKWRATHSESTTAILKYVKCFEIFK